MNSFNLPGIPSLTKPLVSSILFIKSDNISVSDSVNCNIDLEHIKTHQQLSSAAR